MSALLANEKPIPKAFPTVPFEKEADGAKSIPHLRTDLPEKFVDLAALAFLLEINSCLKRTK